MSRKRRRYLQRCKWAAAKDHTAAWFAAWNLDTGAISIDEARRTIKQDRIARRRKRRELKDKA